VLTYRVSPGESIKNVYKDHQMDDSGYYPSNSVPLAQLFSCLLGSLTATHRTIIEFATMPFHKSLLLALLGASTVLCRSLVNLDHGPNDMLSESSVPAFVGRPHDLLEVSPSGPRTCAYCKGVDTDICPTPQSAS
jgi:hypothetical protein